MKKDNFTSSCPIEISNLFADKFQGIYRNSTNYNTTFTHTNSNVPDILNSLFITIDDIANAISHLDLNKGPGPDRIPPNFLFNCSHSLSPVLSTIFNNSLSSGVFPSAWKSSFIIPIHKKGDKTSVDNYRGIAILSSIPKLFEKIVTTKITPILDPLLNEEQHGFRKGRSTTTNLVIYISKILRNMEKGFQVDAIYTDFSKAFDRVDHKILKKKLLYFGINGSFLNWISSYLSNRTQKVKFQGVLSKPILASSGVPQGSHLGPLLFNIFISDLSAQLNGVDHIEFADDLKMSHIIKNDDDSDLLQSNLRNLDNWCLENNLELNLNKCQVISFSRKRSVSHYNYTIQNHNLVRVKQVTDLGIIFDHKLNFNLHYDFITSRATKMLGFVKRRACEFENLWVTKTLYCSFVRSILEYCSIVWNPCFSVHSNRIESIQKQFLLFALRHIYDPRDFQSLPSYLDRLNLVNILSLESRRTMLSSCFTFDVLTNIINVVFINNNIVRNDEVRQTRHTRFLVENYHRTEYANNEPINRCCRIFNEHSHIFSATASKNVFKSNLCRYLYQLQQ